MWVRNAAATSSRPTASKVVESVSTGAREVGAPRLHADLDPVRIRRIKVAYVDVLDLTDDRGQLAGQ